MNKSPPELHIVQGTRGVNQGKPLPEKIKSRIPKAEWLDNPKAWDKDKFIEETAEYLYQVYGIGSAQDRHVLAMLADHISTYVLCAEAIRQKSLITAYNNGKTLGPNPYLAIRDRALPRIISLMNELGLTPRSRLNGNRDDATPLGDLLLGPQVKR
jgi:phage terminase small subunit